MKRAPSRYDLLLCSMLSYSVPERSGPPEENLPPPLPNAGIYLTYQISDGLVFADRVGTGFSEKLLASIDGQLQKLRRATCPFINLPEKSRGRWGPWDYPCRHETVPLGQTGTGRPGQVY